MKRPDIDPGILNGIRILDFTWVLAGPYATRLLADFGAEVIKVLPPQPPPDDEFSRGYYQTWNRNKLGVSINLNRPPGIALVKRLVNISDAVVENFSPRVMANWGLDYPELEKINPGIIMLSLSLMGHTGPWRNYVGFAPTVHAFSGMSRLTSYPGQPPAGPGFAYADHTAALIASLALLGALEHRRRTGEGQFIDVSQVEALAYLLGDAIIDHTLNQRSPGNRTGKSALDGVYRCRGEDRWCAITVSPKQWPGFKEALGRPVWTEDRRFARQSGRLRHADEIDRLVERWTMEHTPGEVMGLLQQHGVAAGVVQDACDLANDAQLKSRGFFIRRGEQVWDASPIRMLRSPARCRQTAPLPGRDDGYVFRDLLGLSDGEIARLKRDRII